MWSYTILRHDMQGWFAPGMIAPVADLAAAMNELGAIGWELVTLTEAQQQVSRGSGGSTVMASRGAEFYFKKVSE